MLYIMYICLFFGGIATGARFIVSYCYFNELAPSKYSDIMGCGFMFVEMSITLWISLYFRYISTNWIYLAQFGAFNALWPVILISIFVPESPKWLYSMKRYTECQESLK